MRERTHEKSGESRQRNVLALVIALLGGAAGACNDDSPADTTDVGPDTADVSDTTDATDATDDISPEDTGDTSSDAADADADTDAPTPGYSVTVDYPSLRQPLVAVDLHLVEEGDCDALLDAAWPPGFVPLTTVRVPAEANGSFAPAFVGVPGAQTPAALVAFGYTASVADESPAPWASAVGCIDTLEAAAVPATTASITLADRWPHIEGAYAFEGTGPGDFYFDGVSRPVLELVGEFADDPGAALLRVLAANACAAAACSGSYADEAPWDALFDTRGDGTVELSTMGRLVAAILEGALDDGIGVLGGDSSAREVLAPTSAAIDDAVGFGLGGTLSIARDADGSGDAGDAVTLALGTARFATVTDDWRTTWLPESAVAATGPFDATIDVIDDEATIELLGDDAYGLGLANLVLNVESDVLLVVQYETLGLTPAFAGLSADITSISALFAQLVPCDGLADRVACEGEYAGDPDCDDSAAFVASVIRSACEATVAGLDPYVWIEEIAASEPSSYALSTPASCLAEVGRDLAQPALLHRLLGVSSPAEHPCLLAGTATDGSPGERPVELRMVLERL